MDTWKLYKQMKLEYYEKLQNSKSKMTEEEYERAVSNASVRIFQMVRRKLIELEGRDENK